MKMVTVEVVVLVDDDQDGRALVEAACEQMDVEFVETTLTSEREYAKEE